MPTAELILDAHAELGECPVWLESSAELLWVDVEAGDLHWLDPATRVDRSQHVEGPLGAALPDRAGGLVLALPRRICRPGHPHERRGLRPAGAAVRGIDAER